MVCWRDGHWGWPLPFRWRDGLLDQEEFARLNAEPAGRRAMALVQVGRRDLAEAELRHLYPGADPALAHAVEALADVAAMPSLAMRLGFVRSKRFPETMAGPHIDVASRYPLGPWQPSMAGAWIGPWFMPSSARKAGSIRVRAVGRERAG